MQRVSTFKDSTLGLSNAPGNVMDKSHSSSSRTMERSKFFRTTSDKMVEWHKVLLAKLKEEENEKRRQRLEEATDTPFMHFTKTCNLIFGTLLFSFSNYAFLYCFEIRRYNALQRPKPKYHGYNWVFMYGQVLTIIIVPLTILVIWKLRECTKPLWIQLATSLIPFLVVVSLVITSGRIRYESTYLSTYVMEV